MVTFAREWHGVSLLGAMLLVAVGRPARCDILGFGNFSGFSINRSDPGAAPILSPGKIQITNASSFQGRSIFYDTRQDITKFTASFTYQTTGGSAGGLFGTAFVIQNSVDEAQTVAVPGGIGFSFGYGPAFNNSMALSMEIPLGQTQSGLYTNGQVGGGGASTTPVNAFSGNPISVTLSYNGSILEQTMTDTATLQSYHALYPLNLPEIAGGPTAYVGFTGGGGLLMPNGNQFISDFRFTSVPEPASAILLALGGALIGVRRLRNYGKARRSLLT